jgi:hypothetical protein
MSADNWAECPKCKLIKASETSEYGKVSEAEYLTQQKQRAAATTYTLREDYELGVDTNGVFDVSYQCNCSVCHWEFTYRYTSQVLDANSVSLSLSKERG